jgi:Replication protein A OB domain
LTLWGTRAENFAVVDKPIYAFKSVRVSDYGGRLSSMFAT